jgi:hypothetical protein
MPIKKDPKTGKFAIGSGKFIFKTKEAAEKAFVAFLAKTKGKKK